MVTLKLQEQKMKEGYVLYEKISLEKLIRNTDSSSYIEKDTNLFIQFLFNNILYTGIKTESILDSKIALNKACFFSSVVQKYKFEDLVQTYDEQLIYFNLKDQTERKLLSDLKISDGKLNKQEAYDILTKLEKNYEDRIICELLQYDRETCLQILCTFSSTLSFINFNHRYWKKEEPINRNKLNLLSELLYLIYQDKKFEIDAYFGEMKKALEYSIHFVLNTEDEFKDISNKPINFPQLTANISLLSKVKEFRILLPEIYRDEGYLFVSDVIYVEQDMARRIDSLMRKNSEVIYPLNESESLKIYEAFSKEYGFSPQFLDKYIDYFEDNFLDYSSILSLIEAKALVADIQNRTGQTKLNIESMLKELTLTPVDITSIYTESFSPDNRFFRTPLIKIGDCYIFSLCLLAEATQYFKYRILKNQLSFHVKKSIKNITTKTFDEHQLTTLNELMDFPYLTGAINFPLNDNPLCKHLFQDVKGLPQEIDFYIIQNKNLYIMDLKNNDLSRNLKGVKKEIENATKGKKSYIAKLKSLEAIINENKAIMQNVFGEQFDNIHLFLAFSNPHYLLQEYDIESGVTICSVEDFIVFISKHLINIS